MVDWLLKGPMALVHVRDVAGKSEITYHSTMATRNEISSQTLDGILLAKEGLFFLFMLFTPTRYIRFGAWEKNTVVAGNMVAV